MRAAVGWLLTLSQTLIFCSSVIVSLDDFCLFLSPEKVLGFFLLYRGKPILFYLLSDTIGKRRPGNNKAWLSQDCWTMERHLAYASLQPWFQVKAAQGRCSGECGEGVTCSREEGVTISGYHNVYCQSQFFPNSCAVVYYHIVFLRLTLVGENTLHLSVLCLTFQTFSIF